MKFIISFHPDLHSDLFYAAEWYDSQIPGLGDRFLIEFESIIKKISQNPFAFAICLNHFRQVKLDRFPYVLVYEIDGQNIFIQKLIHGSRHPQKRIWRNI